jgi:hypothetical protein
MLQNYKLLFKMVNRTFIWEKFAGTFSGRAFKTFMTNGTFMSWDWMDHEGAQGWVKSMIFRVMILI